MFYNALNKGNVITIEEIFKFEIIEILCEAINNSYDIEILEVSFSSILLLLNHSNILFNTFMNIKNELNSYKSIINIEKFAYGTNEISFLVLKSCINSSNVKLF